MMNIEAKTNTNRKRVWYVATALVAVGITIALVVLLTQREKKYTVLKSPTNIASLADSGSEMVSLTSDAMVRSGIGVVTVESREFSSKISTVGVIEIPEPAEKIIAARARGRIEHMFVAATGEYVRRGERLFEFYSPDILSAEKDYLIAAGNGKSDQANMPGMSDHADAGLTNANKKRLELYGLTEDQIRQLKQNGTVANTVIVTAPMDGVVLEKLSQEGAYVDEGASIFQLADLSTVWAEINVPEQAIRFVRLAQSITIYTESYPGEKFVGKVILISPVEDQTSRTIRVRLSLPNPSYKLRPQMTFSATISSDLGRSLSIPQDAVVRTGTGNYVWVLDSGNMFSRHEVTLGVLSPDNYYQVVSGLALGEKVASNGSFLVDAEHEITKGNPMAGMNMGETSTKSSGEGTATVRAIDMQLETITLDHGNVPGVMPPMTMAYKASDPKFLQSVKINESVHFTLTRMGNGDYEITAIEKQ
jgi:Cu(I)/Ag(I) efflux system membrane fusion protein